MKPLNRTLTLWIGALCAFGSIQTVHAWGNQGHQVVGLIAEKHLTPAAKQAVDELLALEPGSTLASIGSWADEHRARTTAPWHYVNLPRGDCRYVAVRDCPDGHCVVAAIERQVAIYRSKAKPEDRLKALKYVVHFVGDIHQPLHAGHADDKGGNTYQLQAFGRGTNLHALWDVRLLAAIQPDANTLSTELSSSSSNNTTFDPVKWAEESCNIVAQKDFYPPRKLPDNYASTYGPIVKSRLQQAGWRLARLLNE